jgi:hypothetical protein
MEHFGVTGFWLGAVTSFVWDTIVAAVLCALDITEASVLSPDEEDSNWEELVPNLCFSSADATKELFDVCFIVDEDSSFRSSAAILEIFWPVSKVFSDPASYASI